MKLPISYLFLILVLVPSMALSQDQSTPQTNQDSIEIVRLKDEIARLKQISENKKMDFLLFSYDAKKEKKDTSRFIDEKLEKFYGNNNISRLPFEVAENGNVESYVECGQILELGLCANLDRYDGIYINTSLKNSDKPDTLFMQFVEGYPSDGEGNVFIKLADLLEKAYQETLDDGNYCCPEDDEETKAKKLKELLEEKLCHALQFPKGIEIYLVKDRTVVHKVNLRTYGTRHSFKGEGEFVKIEPRQYVTIYEKKKLDNDPLPIWYLRKRHDPIIKEKFQTENIHFGLLGKFYDHQVYPSVDNRSVLEIKFDQELLAKNIDFYGNISLAARVKNRDIEVAPYFVIGEEQRTYGVNSQPISMISDNFLRLMIETLKTASLYRKISPPIWTITNYSYDRENIQNALNNAKLYIEKAFYADSARAKEIKNDSTILRSKTPMRLDENQKQALRNYLLYNFNSSFFYLYLKDSSLFYSVEEALSEITRLTDNLNNSRFRAIRNSSFDDDSKNYVKFINSSKRCYSFMEYFNSSGNDSKDAFLSMSSITKIDFEAIYQEVKSSLEYLSNYPKWSDITVAESKKQGEIFYHIDRLINALGEFKLAGNEIFEALKQVGYNPDFIKYQRVEDIILKGYPAAVSEERFNKKYETKDYLFRTEMDSLTIQKKLDSLDNIPANLILTQEKYLEGEKNDYREKWYYLDELSNSLESEGYSLLYDYSTYKQIQRKIAELAGERLFGRMLYATIDLQKSEIQDGDQLEIFVMWYNINGGNSETANDGVRLATAKFQVVQSGWSLNAAESALLINRLKESFVTQDVAESNYKPAAGASLLWSYRTDKRGDAFSRTFKWLEPSIGLNVSYVDFDLTKDFEIGVGPILGLWQNKVFMTGGKNLRVGGKSPFYFGVGFSFLNLFQTIKGKIEQ